MRTLCRALLVGVVLVSMAWPSRAASVGETVAREVGRRWLRTAPPSPAPMGAQALLPVERLREFKDDAGHVLAYIVDQPSGGFVIVAADDRVDPVVFFSPTGHCSGAGDPRNPLRALLLADLPWRMTVADGDPKVKSAVAAAWDNAMLGGIDPTNLVIVRDRFMTTEWNQSSAWVVYASDGQGWPFTYNLHTPQHYVAGCTAVALGQILKWFQHPPAARGAGDIVVGGHDTAASFDSHYEYDQMPDRLEHGVTPYAIEQVATLLRDTGTSVGMKYSSTGSGAWPDPDTMKSVFGYVSADWQSTFWTDHRTEMQSDLRLGYPIMIAIHATSETGHTVVGDGFGWLGSCDVYHLNMGWGGADDGWYPMPGLVMHGHTWNTCDGFVYNIRPPVIRKVDALISATEALNTFIGDDIYGVASLAQRVRKPVSPLTPTSFYVLIDNEGTFPDRFRFSAPESYAYWTARYFNQDEVDVTSSIAVTNWCTPLIRPGEKYRLRVSVEVAAGVPVGEVHDFRVRVTSSSDATKEDGVIVRAERVSSRPTVLIRVPGGTYSELMPCSGTPVGASIGYDILLRNDGQVAERFTLQGWKSGRASDTVTYWRGVADPNLSNWSVNWFTAASNNITAAVEAGCQPSVLLSPGGTQEFRVVMSPGAAVVGGHACQAVLRALSADRLAADTVRGEAWKAFYHPRIVCPPAQVVSGGTAARYGLTLSSGSSARDSFTLSGGVEGATPPGWTVQYFTTDLLGSYVDITSEVTHGTWVSRTVASIYTTLQVDLYVTPSADVPDGEACDVRTVLTSRNDPHATAETLTHTVKGSRGADLQIGLATNAYGDMPVTGRARSAEPLEFHCLVRNSGPLSDYFRLRTEETGANGWTIRYYGALPGGADISAALRAGTWWVGPLTNNQAAEGCRFVVEPDAGVANDATCSIRLVATSETGSATDTVSAVVSKSRYEPHAVIKTLDAPAYQEGEAEDVATPSTPAIFRARILNHGEGPDVFALTADLTLAPPPNWSSRYFSIEYKTNAWGETLTNVVEITDAITKASGWQTGIIPAGEAQDIQVEIHVGGGLAAGSVGRLRLTAASLGCSLMTGQVTAVAIKSSYRPTVLVRSAGYGAFDAGASTQTIGVGTAVYEVLIRNEGTDVDTYALSNVTVTTASGDWAVRFIDTSDGKDVTSDLNGGQLSLEPLGRGAAHQFRAEVTPGNNVPTNSDCCFTLTAHSKSDPGWQGQGWGLTRRAPCAVRIEVLGEDGYTRAATGRITAGSNPISYIFRVRNEGGSADSFGLTAYHASDLYGEWSVRYFDAPREGREITPEITATAWTTPVLAPGEALVVRVEMVPSAVVPAGATCDLSLYAESVGYMGAWDRLTIPKTVKGACQPALLIRNLGARAYSETGCTQRARSGTSAVYVVSLANDGQAADGFRLVPSSRVNAGDAGAWLVRYYDAATNGTEVTSDVLAGTRVFGPLPPASNTVFRIEVEAPPAAPRGVVHTLGLTAESQGNLAHAHVDAMTALRSILRILSVSVAGSGPDVILSWESDPDLRYTVEYATNLTAGQAFSNWVTHVTGNTGRTIHTNTPPAAGAGFYRVKEEHQIQPSP